MLNFCLLSKPSSTVATKLNKHFSIIIHHTSKALYQSFMSSFNFYLSAKELCKECHPDPQPSREATLPSHPTPNLSTNPCILQFRVSDGGQCVSGALWCGWEEAWGLGKQCGMLFLWRGMGWRLSSSGLPLKQTKKDKAALRQHCDCKLQSGVGTAGLVLLAYVWQLQPVSKLLSVFAHCIVL